MKRYGHELAAVITEPIMANMGCILPEDGYLQRIGELTRECGALFILDEVVTGFRYAPGGAQQFYGIQPDLSTFGKALGAGFPVGAVAGPRSILDRMRWSERMVLHYGTFNGHRLTMEAIAANLDLLSAPGTYSKLHAIGNAATQGYSRFIHSLLDQGIYMTPSSGLHSVISTAHVEADVETLVQAADRACENLT